MGIRIFWLHTIGVRDHVRRSVAFIKTHTLDYFFQCQMTAIPQRWSPHFHNIFHGASNLANLGIIRKPMPLVQLRLRKLACSFSRSSLTPHNRTLNAAFEYHRVSACSDVFNSFIINCLRQNCGSSSRHQPHRWFLTRLLWPTQHRRWIYQGVRLGNRHTIRTRKPNPYLNHVAAFWPSVLWRHCRMSTRVWFFASLFGKKNLFDIAGLVGGGFEKMTFQNLPPNLNKYSIIASKSDSSSNNVCPSTSLRLTIFFKHHFTPLQHYCGTVTIFHHLPRTNSNISPFSGFLFCAVSEWNAWFVVSLGERLDHDTVRKWLEIRMWIKL